MIRLSAAVFAALMALTPLSEAAAQSRERDTDRREQPQRPRVTPDEARRNAEATNGGRRVGMRVRPDGNYGVVMERNGQVREVVVDSRTGEVRGQGRDQRPR